MGQQQCAHTWSGFRAFSSRSHASTVRCSQLREEAEEEEEDDDAEEEDMEVAQRRRKRRQAERGSS